MSEQKHDEVALPGHPLADFARIRSVRVLLNLLGPAYRGLWLKRGKQSAVMSMPAEHAVTFDWSYAHGDSELAKLYAAAKRSQWDGDTELDWSCNVDPYDESRTLLPDEMLPLMSVKAYGTLPRDKQLEQKVALTAWLLSQFLHGEQAALYAACQVTEAITSWDGKLYGSTQVVDEGRHVEVFERYIRTKLQKLYQVNDNLYTIIDALMTDGRWDLKFLGMQIMIEGLALGAFGTMRHATKEPLLKQLLGYVITDEARHVHYGVVSLRDCYASMPERERREREDWVYEISVLMRNRFLAHEFYDEYYAHAMTRREWNQLVLDSPFMHAFRQKMFRRLIPNLKRIHLLSDRIRPHYEKLGLLAYEHGKAAPELQAADLLDEDASGRAA